jgi:hypothetical protein
MRRGVANCFALENVVGNSRTPGPGEVTALMNGINAMYVRVREGTGTEEDVIGLGLVLNTGAVRGKDIASEVVDAFTNAGEALLRCEARKDSHGRYGFDGPGFTLMNDALELYEGLVTMSSIRQMHDAEQTARKWMFENARKAA